MAHLSHNDVGVLSNERQVEVVEADIRARGVGGVGGRDVVVKITGKANGSVVPLTILA
jgi:hypothetical protein